ncbi:hypothetical protein [Yoonia sp. SDW83-1]|uniref:hypothetical protein n=1 Tax=Yoonia sp. SDW83-1 TaxID=3366945 RepID=UPI00398C4D57
MPNSPHTPRSKSEAAEHLAAERIVWTEFERNFISVRQEQAYRELADRSGLNGDIDAAIARFRIAAPTVDEMMAQSRARKPADLTADQEAEFFHLVETNYAAYFRQGARTEWGNPLLLGAWELAYDKTVFPMRDAGLIKVPRPLMATTPCGSYNAQIWPLERTIMFFDEGLYLFMGDLAKIFERACPEITPETFYNDEAMSHLPDFPPPDESNARLLADLLEVYILKGTPQSAQRPPRRDPNSTFGGIFHHMLGFVLLHETGHEQLGHLGQKPCAEFEFQADHFALNTLSSFTRGTNGSFGIGFWAALLALFAIEFLDRALWVLDRVEPMDNMQWAHDIYPSVYSRRQALIDEAMKFEDWPARLAFDRITANTSVVMGNLAAGVEHHLIQRQSLVGAPRPSPLWHDHLDASFPPKEPNAVY